MRIPNPIAALACLGAAACALVQAPAADETAWRAWIGEMETDYARSRLAVLKVNDAIFLKPGQSAYLRGTPDDAMSYVWSLDTPAAPVLSVTYAADEDGAPRAVLTRDGQSIDLHGAVMQAGRYAVSDDIDIAVRPSGQGTDDPRLELKSYNQRHPAAAAFRGLSFFPFAPELRIEAAFVAVSPPRAAALQTERGLVKQFFEIGRAEFTLGGAPVSMPIYALSPDTAQVAYATAMFTDATTGEETYGVGRYLDIEGLDHDFPPARVMIDFNRAYNPMCARSPYFNCPLVDFHIPVAVRAGERYDESAAPH
jgi:uncharacterized protein